MLNSKRSANGNGFVLFQSPRAAILRAFANARKPKAPAEPITYVTPESLRHQKPR